MTSSLVSVWRWKIALTTEQTDNARCKIDACSEAAVHRRVVEGFINKVPSIKCSNFLGIPD